MFVWILLAVAASFLFFIIFLVWFVFYRNADSDTEDKDGQEFSRDSSFVQYRNNEQGAAVDRHNLITERVIEKVRVSFR